MICLTSCSLRGEKKSKISEKSGVKNCYVFSDFVCCYVVDGLRHLFCQLSMQQQENEQSLMEILLLADTQLWKSELSIHNLYLYCII
jgi:hypothetical protein